MTIKFLGVTISIFVLLSCSKNTTELEGTWGSACALTLKSYSVFSGDTFKIDLASHADTSCKTEVSRATVVSGTFAIAGDATTPAGAKKLDLTVTTPPPSRVIYTVYKLDSTSLSFTTDANGANDGSTDAKRIDSVGTSASTKQ